VFKETDLFFIQRPEPWFWPFFKTIHAAS
jgi:hypothetical protein